MGGRDYVNSTVRGITDEINFNGTGGITMDTQLDERPTSDTRSENASDADHSKEPKRYPSSRALEPDGVVV